MNSNTLLLLLLITFIVSCAPEKSDDNWVNIEYKNDAQLLDLGFFKEKVAQDIDDTIGMETGALAKLYSGNDTIVRFKKISTDSVEKIVFIKPKNIGGQLNSFQDTLKLLSNIRGDIFYVKKEGLQWFLWNKESRNKCFEVLLHPNRILLLKESRIE